MNLQQLKIDWFGNVRADVLAGMTVALALIPEAIAFSIIAGVDPMVGLYASFCIAVIISIVGGRPGMISAATGAMALVMVTLVADHGLEYLFAATVLTGIIQIIMGALKLGRFITFVPYPVIIGFVNALAILIFMAQLEQFEGARLGNVRPRRSDASDYLFVASLNESRTFCLSKYYCDDLCDDLFRHSSKHCRRPRCNYAVITCFSSADGPFYI